MTVTNPYYEFDPNFLAGSVARSSAVNLQFAAIQTAFDFLPGVNDAVITDTAVFAPESGSGNAYVVTMSDTRTSNNDGDGIRFFATHTNTGATTLNVDGIGAVALVNWAGTALSGSEIVSGQIYEVRYDASNTQFVLAATTDAALQVTYSEEWANKAEDSLITVAAGGDGSTEYSALHWAAKSLLSATAARVNTDIVTATPPTTEAVSGGLVIYDAIAQDDDLLGRFGFVGSNDLQFKNTMHGGGVIVTAENAAGVEQTILTSDVDAITEMWGDTEFRVTVAVGRETAIRAIANSNVELHNNGVRVFSTTVSGGIVYSRTSTDTENRLLSFAHQDGTNRAAIGFVNNDDIFIIHNHIDGGDILIEADDSGNVLRTGLRIDPDAITFIRGDTRVDIQVDGASPRVGASWLVSGTDVLHEVQSNVGLTAHTGSSQGDGVITSSYNVYSTVGSAGDAATLPATFGVSTIIYIKNDAATNAMDVFPASGDDAGAGSNTAVSISAGDFAVFFATAANATWTKLLGGTA